MRRVIVGTLATLALGLASLARAATDEPRDVELAPGVDQLEQVDSFVMMTRPHSFTPIDRDTLIVWPTAFDPYLVELAFPSHDLEWAHVIGVTSTGSRVYAKFDAVQVGGFRYPIAGIYKMTREEAKSFKDSRRKTF
ncbi:MAG TPA: DUF6491 family protein [Gammaproteobacteria bacterium]